MSTEGCPVKIFNTDHDAQHPWPDGVYVQGGAEGLVFRTAGGAYRTAFVEAFPDGTFLRGEGATISDAETACWVKFQALRTCPAYPNHGPFEARGYTNGAGFCTHCGGWSAHVLPPGPEPDREPTLLGRVFAGDVEALGEIAHAVANADHLPADPTMTADA
jgi:hypothetical protein